MPKRKRNNTPVESDQDYSDDKEDNEEVYIFTKNREPSTIDTNNIVKDKKQRMSSQNKIYDLELSYKNPFNKKEQKIYDKIVSNYESRNIKEEDIVRSKMSLEDKTDAYELLRVIDSEFDNHGESENWMFLRQVLNKKIKEGSPMTESDQNIINKLNLITNANISISQKIARSDHPEHIKCIIYKKYCEVKDLKQNDESYGKTIMWINKALDIPTKTINLRSLYSNSIDLINKVYTRMNSSIYGQTKVKEKIIESVSAMWANPKGTNKSMVFIGPPGVGKTAFAKFLADSIGLPFYQISFGGNKDASILKGHDNVYIGANSGEIAEGLIKMGVLNGVLFLDEIDKLTDGGQGTLDTLLHILDPQQNSQFKDNFLAGIPLDLSKLLIIASVNSTDVFDGPLLNRLHLVSFNSYSHNEKITIGINYIIPDTMKNLNMMPKEVIIKKDVMSYLVDKSHTKIEEQGVRQLIISIRTIFERINTLKQIYSNKKEKIIKLSYDIPGFKIPFTLTKDHLDTLFE